MSTMAHSEDGAVFECTGNDADRNDCKGICVQFFAGTFRYCKRLKIME